MYAGSGVIQATGGNMGQGSFRPQGGKTCFVNLMFRVRVTCQLDV